MGAAAPPEEGAAAAGGVITVEPLLFFLSSLDSLSFLLEDFSTPEEESDDFSGLCFLSFLGLDDEEGDSGGVVDIGGGSIVRMLSAEAELAIGGGRLGAPLIGRGTPGGNEGGGGPEEGRAGGMPFGFSMIDMLARLTSVLEWARKCDLSCENSVAAASSGMLVGAGGASFAGAALNFTAVGSNEIMPGPMPILIGLARFVCTTGSLSV